MKLITFDDIVNLNLAPTFYYEMVEDMIRRKGETILPPKISMKPVDNVFCNVMPCIIPPHYGGAKIVTRYPERNPSLDSMLLLFDSENGEFLSLMDANYITAMRTGAVAVHSMLHLGKNNFTEIGLVGLGNTARATMLVLAHMVQDRELHVKMYRYKDQAELFEKRFETYKNIRFSYVDDYASLVKGSEVVVSCVTCFDNDICSDECFDEGILVIPVHTRGFSNCDLFFDKVFADDYGHVHHFKYFERFKSFAEVCDVVNGRAPGRENDRERILAYNIGLAIHDINIAAFIYERMKGRDDISDIDLKGPTEKFWI